jgi:DnaJ-like protein
MNFYELLGVPPSASLDEIRVAYRSRIAHYHPDRNPSPHATAITALLNEAWEVLGNPGRRHEYDASLSFKERGAPRATSSEASHITDQSDVVRSPQSQPSAGDRDNSAATTDLSTWNVRILGVLLVGAVVMLAGLGDRLGRDHDVWFALLSWVYILFAIYCFRKSGLLSARGLRWLVTAFLLLAGPFGWGLLAGCKSDGRRSDGKESLSGWRSWLL